MGCDRMLLYLLVLVVKFQITFAITAGTVTLASNTAGVQTTATIALTTTSNVPINGIIEATFPVGFIIASDAVSSLSGIHTSSTLSIDASNRKVKVTVQTSICNAGSLSFVVNKITNPGAQTTGNYIDMVETSEVGFS